MTAGVLPLVSLRPLSLPEVDRLLAGARAPDWHPEYPLTETLVGLRMLLTRHRIGGWAGREVPRWWLHHILVGPQVVGDIGFHGPPGEVLPTPGPVVVEVGYDVVPALRGRGVATAACRLLLALAWCDGAEMVEAETEPDNLASQRVLTAAGFAADPGGRWWLARPAAELPR